MNRIERVRMNETFIQLAADAIQRRHPSAEWLAHKRPQDMTDAMIERACEKLTAWISEQPPLTPGQE